MSIWDVMARQHGIATHTDLEAEGVSPSTAWQWVEDGKLLRLHKNVYAAAGSPDTLHRRCLAALKAVPTSALSHRTACHFWDLYEDEPPVEIVVARTRSPELTGVIVHRARDPFEIHHRSGLAVTSPMRAVLDLGAVEPAAVAGAVEQGRVANLFSIAALEWQLVEVARQGRRGVGALRRVLDGWALAAKRPDGVLEPRFARLSVRFGLPEPTFQHHVGPYRVDFAYPELKIAIEVDGYAFHSGVGAFQRDRDRQNHLVGLGWTVLRFTWQDVVKRPSHVAKVITDAIGHAQFGMPA